jgi:hypothetical protein
VLRDQRDVFGPVASTPTAWRVLAGVDTNNLNARGQPEPLPEVAWLQTVGCADQARRVHAVCARARRC